MQGVRELLDALVSIEQGTSDPSAVAGAAIADFARRNLPYKADYVTPTDYRSPRARGIDVCSD